MSSIHSHIRPNTFLFLRLPSDILKLLEILPNTIIEVGKLGSFPSNLLLGRPYYHTYEIRAKRDGEAYSRLRIVPPGELNADIVAEDATPSESRGEPATPSVNGQSQAYDVVSEDGTVVVKNNRLTIDDASRQALSQQEIEELKKSSGGNEVIEKILANHAGLDEKTSFSKAKYTLRKTKKYLKRFTVLPMDLGNVIEYVMAKEAPRIMELREETSGLMMAWGNVHAVVEDEVPPTNDGRRVGAGRWLVHDETGGLLVAAMAERMGILYVDVEEEEAQQASEEVKATEAPEAGLLQPTDGALENAPPYGTSAPTSHNDFPLPASTNTITLLHPAVQPNLSLMKYFGYDTNQPNPVHPMHTHLKPLSWLQLLHPDLDATYREPEKVSDAELRTYKSGKRSTHYKKLRRWSRCKAIVDETREGGFDGLVIAANMDPATILPHTIPLIRGGGTVVVYSSTPEPLIRILDLYSKDRRTAYISHLSRGEIPDSEDFPVDPRLLLAPTVQSTRARAWQVLPGRTHPVMTSRGGAEGYVLSARRVMPVEGGVEARGNYGGRGKRKADALVGGVSDAGADAAA
ncbi:tRNA (adenine(58)-N(1))-methyltransferase non-catalytic subunit trm6 [Vermiconidia calcicola]|uniref:tRNA (Adenine(58)-N(1))-methyltransferase non-catalytic subunit trm6 n=1 Tax=Vermiconidia calcicola TaxID=1690605 RepID=A0ACC3MRC0_9PEZI|nr:tRNA (adenine(58)-N(1))-methyltransferase non-catalytic subunit trm6 [Vermiconidia calcicola]